MTYENYKAILPTACRVAAKHILEYFKCVCLQMRIDLDKDFRFFQGSPQYPAFQHLGFRLKNQVYSVLVALTDPNGEIVVDSELVELQKEACKKYNLIPSMILFKGGSVISLFPSAPFPLISTYYLEGKNDDISPDSMDLEKVNEMSEWEINSIGIWFIRHKLFNEKSKILSYCDIVDVYPNVWFEKDGKKNMVFAKVFGPDGMIGSFPEEMSPQQKHKLGLYSCFYAEVTLIPNNEEKLIRGNSFRIKYSGLKPFDLDTLADCENDYIIRSDIE